MSWDPKSIVSARIGCIVVDRDGAEHAVPEPITIEMAGFLWRLGLHRLRPGTAQELARLYLEGCEKDGKSIQI